MRKLKHAKLEKVLREQYVTKIVMIDSLLNQKSVFKNRKMKFQHFHISPSAFSKVHIWIHYRIRNQIFLGVSYAYISCIDMYIK